MALPAPSWQQTFAQQTAGEPSEDRQQCCPDTQHVPCVPGGDPGGGLLQQIPVAQQKGVPSAFVPHWDCPAGHPAG